MHDCNSQILSSIPANNCCSLTFVNAVISFASQIDENRSLILINSDSEILNKVSKIVSNIYPSIEQDWWKDFLLLKGNIFEFLNSINYSNDLNLNFIESDCDKLTFFKSAFLTCGHFYYNKDNNANSKGYSLEFVFKNKSFAETILSILKELNFDLKLTARYSNYVVYTKNSNIICDLLVTLGASYTALDVQNSLAIREMRNAANRQNNCFEFNLDKTLSASDAQLEAINYIVNNYSIDYLPENLREVALARIANPDVSLNDLRAILNNNISRAGIKYRLDKIIELYKKLKGEN